MKGLAIATLLILSAEVYAQDSVNIRKISKNNFVATLLSQSDLQIDDAQQRLLVAASKTCKNLSPTFGHYEFKSNINISSPSPTTNQFQFDQEFTCTIKAEVAPGQAVPTNISESDKERLVELVTKETQTFVDSTNGDTLKTFHSRFSDQLSAMLPRSEWTKQQLLLRKNSGAIEASPQFNVTVYVDPPNSPAPGIYLAVDFQVKYERAAFRCGYVMWLYDQQSNLSVLRIEDGIIYDKDAASMTADQIAQTMVNFRCIGP